MFYGGEVCEKFVCFIGGKVCDLGSGVRLGLIKSEENLLHQILKEDLRESLPATFLIYFLCVFPKPSRRRAKSKDFAINPSAPISIAKSSTVHPFSFKAVFNFAYLAVFRSCASTIFLSKGTVFSNQIIRFFDKEKITMSGRCRVNTDVSGGIVALLLKSKFTCQSVGKSV